MWSGAISITPFDLSEVLRGRPMKARIRKISVSSGSIDEQAELAASREEIGHRESDTVTRKKSCSEPVVLTIVEKVTDFYIAIKIP